MYKVSFKVSESAGNLLQELKSSGFVPLYYRKDKGVENYVALIRSNDLNEVKDAILDFAILAKRRGRGGGRDFATIYKVNDQIMGKAFGSTLGGLLGLKLAGIPGLVLGALGGLLAGEILDVNLGDSIVGVEQWPISLTD
ncbi:hypothetical protein [Sulfuracidifex metallicus]|jgi:uncharacterized membrane protein|uniref:DUF1269 domain-containing protein n=1 Tax=Sulfuracidifex metallicus DSM 6482 = JCM 9184 TaxID=523847 RepID=A0A6A9QHP2_SULME|nr:hypothetical protein [Sulfuracidifex metallicus]MUN28214.1 hypothetical protein [Sulfuracidifex metallicus DSM 6482 = JCM 9184]WOE51253.1 hypothetical protein RQ359_000522 [Sulfuracidifex metallicus DSM 6482 = JCM 9184]